MLSPDDLYQQCIFANLIHDTGFHLDILFLGGGAKAVITKVRAATAKVVIKQYRIMCMYDIYPRYLLKIATTLTCMEHEVHVYCRKDII